MKKLLMRRFSTKETKEESAVDPFVGVGYYLEDDLDYALFNYFFNKIPGELMVNDPFYFLYANTPLPVTVLSKLCWDLGGEPALITLFFKANKDSALESYFSKIEEDKSLKDFFALGFNDLGGEINRIEKIYYKNHGEYIEAEFLVYTYEVDAHTTLAYKGIPIIYIDLFIYNAPKPWD